MKITNSKIRKVKRKKDKWHYQDTNAAESKLEAWPVVACK